MKKNIQKLTSIIVTMLMFICVFSGCIRLKDSFEPMRPAEEIESITIYDFTNNEHSSFYYNIDFSTETWTYYEEYNAPPQTVALQAVGYVEQANHKAFMDELTALKYAQIMPLFPVAFDPNHDYYGYTAYIRYQDGTADSVCYALRVAHSETGEKATDMGNCEQEDFNAIIVKYMTAEE